MAPQYFKKVPVLVITSGADEIRRILLALAESSVVPYEEVQRFSEFDEEGKSLKDDWQTIIDDSTKRCAAWIPTGSQQDPIRIPVAGWDAISSLGSHQDLCEAPAQSPTCPCTAGHNPGLHIAHLILSV